jgi:transporter family-2 protein
MSMAFDHFGWLGFTEHAAGIGRVFGSTLMVIGAVLISLF